VAFRECRVAERLEWAPGLVTLTLDRALDPHEPGQFVNLALDLDGERVKRAYSLANPSGAAAQIYLVAVDGGRLSPRLAALAPGDTLLADPRPHGFFVPSELPAPRELWMLATGTGLGPYLAMLRTGRVLDDHHAVVLVHSTREQRHLGHRAELEAIASREPRFRYVPVLTRAPADGLLRGRMQALLTSGELEAFAGLPLAPERSHAMLCGNPTMLEDVGAILAARGLVRHRRRSPGHLTTEAYW
jgi:ferredoxin--NADP+ reductase